jgi:hypothetical protein
VLDLASARRALWSYGSPAPYTTATVTQIGEFDFRLMQVVERFFTLGTWRSMWKRLDLSIYNGVLTLPRGFDTCRQISACGCGPVPIYSQFHRLACCGVSVDPAAFPGWYTGLRLTDENAQTFITPTGTFKLRAVATEVNADGLTLIGGFDQNENELFGEITLATINGASTTTQEFTKLPHIQKTVTANAVLLYAVDTTTSVATLISSFAPGETIPSYRQYDASGFFNDANNDGIADDDPAVVSAICKLGFVAAVSVNDIIVPGNIGALKLGLMAVQFEDRTDPENAKIYMDNAVALLDAELAELQSAEEPVFSVSESFGAGSIPNCR